VYFSHIFEALEREGSTYNILFWWPLLPLYKVLLYRRVSQVVLGVVLPPLTVAAGSNIKASVRIHSFSSREKISYGH
jgi:hypothetical protein